jgi:primosomal protein N' (replication factor Y)
MRITLKHKSDEIVYRAAIEVASVLQPLLGEKVLGPERPYIPRINNYFLQQFLVRLERNPQSASVKQEILLRIRERLLQQDYRQVRLSIDVDPV